MRRGCVADITDQWWCGLDWAFFCPLLRFLAFLVSASFILLLVADLDGGALGTGEMMKWQIGCGDGFGHGFARAHGGFVGNWK
ncbi:hypothetical protein M0R45_016036 [Rubus argutus]|uniref:Uncharacterized protein n=1 Tax=Rubus argutus TaxID=59490 RepID=A0AAW1XRZ3_RUBAR